jgi:hypothetical protein
MMAPLHSNAPRKSCPPARRLPSTGRVAQRLSGGRAVLTETSWSPGRELRIDDWVRHGRSLGAIGRGSGWWIGDWVRFGTARYGEKYDIAARITGYDAQSLMNMAYVASRFDYSRRREKLSFSHHAEVAALPSDEQERWLDRAERERLSCRRLREELRSGPSSRTHLAPVETQQVCPRCGQPLAPSRRAPARSS